MRRECLSFWGLFGGSRVGVGVVAGDRGRTRTRRRSIRQPSRPEPARHSMLRRFWSALETSLAAS